MRRILLGVLVSLVATWICLFIFDTSAHQSVSPKELMILASVQTPSLSKSTTHLNESTTIKNTTPAFDTSVDEFAAVRREENLHIVISSDCSLYQRWQVLTSFHSANAVGQSGQRTWLISGCNEQEKENIEKTLIDHFMDGSKRPIAHFTPDYADMSRYPGPFASGLKKRTFVNRHGKLVKSPYGNRYKFNNKPNALLHWVTSSDGIARLRSDEAIVYIDPDFLFLAPLRLPEGVSIEPGQPVAQRYGLGAQWVTFNRSAMCGAVDTLCATISEKEVNQFYSAGPPYIVHSADLEKLATEWVRLVPRTYDQYPLLYAEMFAYSAAAATFDLKHRLIPSLMTGCMVGWPQEKSNSALFDSAQAFITETRAQISAGQEKKPRHVSWGGASSCFKNNMRPPPLLHYCQHYTSDAFDRGIAKRQVPHNILSCETSKGISGGEVHRGPLELAALGVALKKNAGDGNIANKKSNTRDRTTDRAHRPGSLAWNELAACSVFRGVAHARDEHCLLHGN